MSYMYGICCVPFFFSKNRLAKILFFSNPFPKKRSDCESQKSGFRFDPKNPPWMWILWIDDPFLVLPKKTQNPFLDSEIRIWIFPKKRTQNPDIFETPYFVLKESAFSPHETSESAHSHSFETTLQRGLRLCSHEWKISPSPVRF